VHGVEHRRAWAAGALVLALLTGAPWARAANGPIGDVMATQTLRARFDSVTRQTVATGMAAPGLCFSFVLPDEWRTTAQGLDAVASEGELAVSLRSTQELRDLPHPDLASRDAAVLQRDYEELLGRPAQSVSLSAGMGAARWSATWTDANLPTASRTMTVEALIVPLSTEWVLELSLSGLHTRQAYDALAQQLLSRLRVQGKASCQP